MQTGKVAGALLRKRRMSRSKRYLDPAYISWLCMRKRCADANHEHFKHYGGRGLDICDRWSDFLLFKADMGERPDGMSLERVDNSKGYSPDNCRWATHVEQCSNRRSNVIVQWCGETHTLKQWAEILGIPYKTLWMRRKSGWAIDRMFTEELNHEKSSRTRRG